MFKDKTTDSFQSSLSSNNTGGLGTTGNCQTHSMATIGTSTYLQIWSHIHPGCRENLPLWKYLGNTPEMCPHSLVCGRVRLTRQVNVSLETQPQDVHKPEGVMGREGVGFWWKIMIITLRAKWGRSKFKICLQK